MIQEHLYAEMAGRLLRRRWEGRAPRRTVTTVVAPAKRRLVGAVEQALLDRRQKRRRLKRVRWAAAGVALTLAGTFTLLVVSAKTLPSRALLGHSVPASPSSPASASAARAPLPLRRPSGQLSLRDSGAILSAGARLNASSGRPIRIQSHDGTELTMEPGASLSVLGSGQTHRLALLDGALAVHVGKVPAGERFIVQTPDTEIDVRSSQLRVTVGTDKTGACGESWVTRVTVSEGAVALRAGGREIRLVSGDEWRTTCPVAQQSLAVPSARGAASSAGARAAGPAPGTSSLEAQNEMFSAAMRAKRGGRTGDALDLLGQFLYDYPDSPLIESAMVQRMRLAAADDPTWATSIAIRYLSRFPEGYARLEAQELVAASAQP